MSLSREKKSIILATFQARRGDIKDIFDGNFGTYPRLLLHYSLCVHVHRTIVSGTRGSFHKEKPDKTGCIRQRFYCLSSQTVCYIYITF